MSEGLVFIPLVFILLYGAVIFSLLLLSYPPKPRTKIKLKSKIPLVIPEICVIIGEPTKDINKINFFWGTPYFLVKHEVWLPFSEEGWDIYVKKFPISLKIFKKGLEYTFAIPLIGAYLAIYFWAPLSIFICGPFLIIDFLLRKRQLVKMRSYTVKSGDIYKINITVNSESFAEKLIELNKENSI